MSESGHVDRVRYCGVQLVLDQESVLGAAAVPRMWDATQMKLLRSRVCACCGEVQALIDRPASCSTNDWSCCATKFVRTLAGSRGAISQFREQADVLYGPASGHLVAEVQSSLNCHSWSADHEYAEGQYTLLTLQLTLVCRVGPDM